VSDVSICAGSRTAGHLLTHAQQTIEPAFRAVINLLPEDVRLIAGYHAGLWDARGAPGASARPGKALRPALVLACARGVDGRAERATGPVLAAAVAVELLHDFTLLHDDVMDGDSMRRHRPAAWTVFGAPRAILTGDTLLAAALDQLTGSATAILITALRQLCRGQSADLAFQSRGPGVGVAECVAMVEDKTGALLGCACELGALAAGAPEPEALHYREFGRHLGVAFQITDDILGIWGDPALTGKPLRTDLAARKMTLPVVAALAAGNAASARLRQLYSHPEELTETAVDEAADLVERAGGRAWAHAETERRTELALEALERAGPISAADSDLRLLAGLLMGRSA
jgi:geranylgeranyl diphosphate synthase type I